MIRTALGVLLTATAALGQSEPPKISWDVDAKLTAVDQQFAGFAKLGFDPKSPAPDGDLAELRKRTDGANKLLDEVRNGLAKLQGAAQDEVDAKAKAVNEDVRRFRGVNSFVASNLDFLDRVAAHPTRGDFETMREAYARSWDASYGQEFKRYRLDDGPVVRDAVKPYLADAGKGGYESPGVGNPYTGDYYRRFFDEKGDVVPAVWNAGLAGWKKYQADTKGMADRLRGRGAEIEQKAQSLDQQFAASEAKAKAFETVVGKANDKVNRADLVGTWKGELVQGSNKIGVTLTIEADGKITNTADNGQAGRGTWTRSGERLSARWATGEVVTWTFKDGKISGGGTTGRGEKWSISFSKQ